MINMVDLELDEISEKVISCSLCPRLLSHITQVGKTKVRRFIAQDYWAKPLPGFGDPKARLFIIGLAPAAHGGNRTGRMFTGDRSGDFLYRALYETGFASQPESTSRDDGLKLTGAYVTAAVRCAPPGNKPLPQEFRNCRPYLEGELDLLKDVRVVVALGRAAFDAYLGILRDRGVVARR